LWKAVVDARAIFVAFWKSNGVPLTEASSPVGINVVS
jgi:hypothetical protein